MTSGLIFLLIGFWVGLLLGSFIGGNYLVDFEFAGVRGYEAVGNIGLLLGAVLGLGFGVGIKIKIDDKKSQD